MEDFMKKADTKKRRARRMGSQLQGAFRSCNACGSIVIV